MRVFISINIPKEIIEDIKQIQNNLPDFIGKKTEFQNLHLTLKFLGKLDKDKLEEVKKRLKEIKIQKFEAEINRVGVFSKKFVKIIWLCLENCDFLQEKIDEKLKNLFKPEQRFMGHLTIARVKHVKNKKRFLKDLEKIHISKIKFQVTKFCLVESNLTKKGSHYKVLEEYNLI